MSTFVIPGVGTFNSTALTPKQLSVIFQKLLVQSLGINPTTDKLAYARVRIDWPPPGQPAWLITEDVAFIQCTETPDSYNQIHERATPGNDAVSYTDTYIYSRIWRNTFTFYGPNAGDRARQVKSCMYLDFMHDTLAQSNLYLDTNIGTARRTPELFANQWWERWSFSVNLNEQVTETIVQPSMANVELIIEDADTTFVDTVIDFSLAPNYGDAGFGSGLFGI